LVLTYGTIVYAVPAGKAGAVADNLGSVQEAGIFIDAPRKKPKPCDRTPGFVQEMLRVKRM